MEPTPVPAPAPEARTAGDCPRCHGPLSLPGGSRLAIDRSRLMICGPCCTDEAVRDHAGLAPIPPGEWPVREILTWS